MRAEVKGARVFMSEVALTVCSLGKSLQIIIVSSFARFVVRLRSERSGYPELSVTPLFNSVPRSYIDLSILRHLHQLRQAHPRDLFYPFGKSSGDITTPVSDDGSSPNISISTSFPFFERSYNSLYVNNNGVISFVVPVSQYTPTTFPLPDGRAFIAPFWVDVDNTLRGNIYYRESTEEALLQRATADVRKYSPGLEFQARWVFVATWDNVTYYGSRSSKVFIQCIRIHSMASEIHFRSRAI
ncbi:sushi, nidogen and EGF-like domain-containing protein 1 [Mobula hypostoma]|uniref:sushi, nidogen and EGF-like domain-containing protein 1 n=1 Tax=Mobula hypostoma TaxID=723540 RepID=UPI002FC2F7C5